MPSIPKNPKKKIATTEKDFQRYNAIMLEQLDSKFNMLVEYITGVKETLIERMDLRFDQHETRFDIIENILRDHSQRWVENEKRWEQNDRRWKSNESRWEQNEKRWEKNEKRWIRTEAKIDKISAKLDAVAIKVEEHDVDIQRIKKVVGI